MKFGIDIPNGWKMSLVDIKDPVDAYEAMTNLVTTGDELEENISISRHTVKAIF